MLATPITITLSPQQEADVVRAFRADDRWHPALPTALSEMRAAALCASPTGVQGRRGRTLLQALLVLLNFPSDGRARRIPEVAKAVGVSESTVRVDVRAWAEIGLLERDEESRLYKWVQLVA